TGYPAAQRRCLRILLLVLVGLAVDMIVVGRQAAADEQRQSDPEPSQGAAVPCVIVTDRGGGRLHRGKRYSGPQAEFEVPGHQVEMALATHLAPDQKNCDQSQEKLRRIS